MARDRKRAKQRRDRRERHGGSAAGRPQRPAARPDPGPHDAPDPLEHSSAEVDLAEAQLALGRDSLVGDKPVLPEPEDFGFVDPDELEDEPEHEPEVVPARRGKAGRTESEEHLPAAREDRPGMLARATAFLQGSWRELQRVQWPDRKQVLQATAVVCGFVLVAGLYLGALDVVWQKVIDVLI